jgi:hypothetical protein
MKRVARRFLAAIACLALALLALGAWHRGWSGRELAGSLPDRGPELRRQLEQQHRASAAALAAYRPKVAGKLEDLGTEAEPLLRLQQLPCVVQVERSAPAGRPGAQWTT